MIKPLGNVNSPRNKVAIVFVHGFTGDCTATWNNIPKLLGDEPRMAGWDFFGFGYDSGKRIDISHIWSRTRAWKNSPRSLSRPRKSRVITGWFWLHTAWVD